MLWPYNSVRNAIIICGVLCIVLSSYSAVANTLLSNAISLLNAAILLINFRYGLPALARFLVPLASGARGRREVCMCWRGFRRGGLALFVSVVFGSLCPIS